MDDVAVLPAATTLADFLDSHEAGLLSVAERGVIVEELLSALEDHYALLGFKVSKYGINPLQRLRLLLTRLDEPELEWRFHAELTDIFNSLHDLHTRYTLPLPFRDLVGYLPFLLKEFTEDGRLRYLVGPRQAQDADLDPSFRFGVEVTHWNGVPIRRAIERFAAGLPGANPGARQARAVDRFTFRALGFGPPPDEDWVVIRYLDLEGSEQFITMTWKIGQLAPPPPPATAPATPAVADVAGPRRVSAVLGQGTPSAATGMDVESVLLARTRSSLFAPEFVAAEDSGAAVDPGANGIPVTPAWSRFFEARRVATGDTVIGPLRIRGFDSPPFASSAELVTWLLGFVNEFIRLLDELPPDGLALDIRGNGGGLVAASELCLQTLCARTVVPEPAQFAATPANLAICAADTGLAAWQPSLKQALETGATHSAALPLTAPALFPLVPQAYFGPVVLITDARCYSAADMFAAGFHDNGIGQILGTAAATGAGGANVWQLADLLKAEAAAGESVPAALPQGASLTLAIRRTLRVGPQAGAPLEDYGVASDHQHAPTRADVTHDDADLMAAAAALLRDQPARRLDVTVTAQEGELTFTLGTLGLDRADVLVDGRPRLSIDVQGNPGPVPLAVNAAPTLVEVLGYDQGVLVAARRFDSDGTALVPRDQLR